MMPSFNRSKLWLRLMFNRKVLRLRPDGGTEHTRMAPLLLGLSSAGLIRSLPVIRRWLKVAYLLADDTQPLKLTNRGNLVCQVAGPAWGGRW